MLDENSSIPLYYQLKEIIREKIVMGVWAEGDEVPSERVLVENYGISRATVRRALNELVVEGLVTRKRGRGTFVAKPKVTHDLLGDLSFANQWVQQGIKATSKIIVARLEPPPEQVSEVLALDGAKEVLHIVRVRLANDEPLILETSYIFGLTGVDLVGHDLENVATFEYLQSRGLDLSQIRTLIEPVVASEYEAAKLGVKVGSPLLLLERIGFSGERPVVLNKRIVRGDRCKLYLTLHQGIAAKTPYSVDLKVTG